MIGFCRKQNRQREVLKMQAPFEQNVIALIWDFDKTIAKESMLQLLFKKYGMNETEFWVENNNLAKKYKEKGIKVSKDTIYLNQILTYVEQGRFEGLNNSILRELGKEIDFFEGIPEFFQATKNVIEESDKYKKYHVKLEHYIVSTGLAEMIKGSSVFPFVEDVWACQFFEDAAPSVFGDTDEAHPEGVIRSNRLKQIAFSIDNTSKTRAIFEINKGANKYPDMDVNAKIPSNSRRIPFSNMIYIADGPSDVPVFSVLKQYGGKTFAVYPKGSVQHLNEVDKLREDHRIDMFGEADYRKGSLTHLWLTEHVKKIADRIYLGKEDTIRGTMPVVQEPCPGVWTAVPEPRPVVYLQ